MMSKFGQVIKKKESRDQKENAEGVFLNLSLEIK